MSPQRRHELSDEEWAALEPLLPPQRPTTRRPAKDHRTVLNGILWVLRTGAPWRDLPERYGPWQTVYSRFRRWREAGIWEHILTTLQTDAAHDDDTDGSLAMIDGSSIRAHQQAAGAPKKGALPTRRSAAAAADGAEHLVTERGGKPVVCAITAGQRHESPQAIPLPEQGLERLWPDAVAGDKGYSAHALRDWLETRVIAAVIPKRADEAGPNEYDRELYRERPIIGRTINRLKRFRRIATRHDQLASSYPAMVTIACILEWL